MLKNSKGIKTIVYLKEGEKLLIIHPTKMYKTGYPTEEILLGNTLIESKLVSWDEISQSWID